jgi:hypothetical protein
MESLQVKTGQVSLRILDDAGNERGVFRFNPTDVQSATRLFELQSEFEQRQKELEEKEKQCVTPQEKGQFMVECIDYLRNGIDSVFGEGSSQLLFGNAHTLSMFYDFFHGITPYYQKASEQRMAKYDAVGGK